VHGFFVVLAFPSVALALSGVYNPRPTLWHLHNLSMAVMVAGRVSLGRCPLVEVEEVLRTQAGQEMPYDGSFVNYIFQTSGIALPVGTVFWLSATVAFLSLVAIMVHWRAVLGLESESSTLPSAEASAA
jgi:hypothetical protein